MKKTILLLTACLAASCSQDPSSEFKDVDVFSQRIIELRLTNEPAVLERWDRTNLLDEEYKTFLFVSKLKIKPNCTYSEYVPSSENDRLRFHYDVEVKGKRSNYKFGFQGHSNLDDHRIVSTQRVRINSGAKELVIHHYMSTKRDISAPGTRFDKWTQANLNAPTRQERENVIAYAYAEKAVVNALLFIEETCTSKGLQ
ncbi:hypothetical protein N9D31_03610 [Oligoflexaceae bacterium]|nr:hypothetical protein [Oligoflexaceae bacterium]